MSDRVEKFVRKYSKEPSILFEVAEAYDATNLLLNAIENVGYNPNKIKDYLYSVKNYQGVSGTITIDCGGDYQETKDFNLVSYVQGDSMKQEFLFKDIPPQRVCQIFAQVLECETQQISCTKNSVALIIRTP